MISDKKKIYSIILEKEVKENIDQIAKQEDRSTSAMINWILKKYINDYKENS
jgi:predicted DNA-binding protein